MTENFISIDRQSGLSRVATSRFGKSEEFRRIEI